MCAMSSRISQGWWMVAVLVVVFLGGLNLHAERARGWGFFILCFVVGSAGGLAFILFRDRFRFHWNRQTKPRRRAAMAGIVTLYIVATFVANRHKPDAWFYDTIDVLGGLLLWGMYRVLSRFVDALNHRFFRR